MKLSTCTTQLASKTESISLGGTTLRSASLSVRREKSTKLVLPPASGLAKIRAEQTKSSVTTDVSGDVTALRAPSITLQ